MDSQFNEWLDACRILGFDTVNLFKDHNMNVCCTQCIVNDSDTVWLECVYNSLSWSGAPNDNVTYDVRHNVNGTTIETVSTDSIAKMLKSVDKIHNQYNHSILANCILTTKDDMKSAITAAMNTRDLIKNLVRVKSSNVWSVGINIRDRHDKFGEVLAQFKNNNGGPGDIYIYYDVPIRVYRRWQTATSKGHYFWQYIRNYYKYSKLTGDKRGKLPNAINN